MVKEEKINYCQEFLYFSHPHQRLNLQCLSLHCHHLVHQVKQRSLLRHRKIQQLMIICAQFLHRQLIMLMHPILSVCVIFLLLKMLANIQFCVATLEKVKSLERMTHASIAQTLKSVRFQTWNLILQMQYIQCLKLQSY